MNRKLLPMLLAMGIVLATISCVKDTDFEQAEDVTIRPVVETNLVFFDLEGAEFYDTVSNIPRAQLSDTTEIRFLDDTGFQENLLRAEFLFRFDNRIPRDFLVTYDFISEAGEITYSTFTTVPAGSEADPSTPEDFVEIIEGQGIIDLTSANRVVVTVSMDNAIPGLPGSFNMQSTATFFLEIKERD